MTDLWAVVNAILALVTVVLALVAVIFAKQSAQASRDAVTPLESMARRLERIADEQSAALKSSEEISRSTQAGTELAARTLRGERLTDIMRRLERTAEGVAMIAMGAAAAIEGRSDDTTYVNGRVTLTVALAALPSDELTACRKLASDPNPATARVLAQAASAEISERLEAQRRKIGAVQDS